MVQATSSSADTPPNAPGVHGPPDLHGHLPALDGIRGLAILLVLMVNLYDGPVSGPLAAGVFSAFESGWIGVNLFFVLSGFLITGILLDAKGGPHFFRNFYARRVLRIFPLYYGMLLVWLVALPRLSWLAANHVASFREHQWWYWSYLANFRIAFARESIRGEPTDFWSLAVEEQFYLLWPVIVALSDRRRLMMLCAGIVLTAPAIRVAYHLLDSSYLTPTGLYYFTLSRLDDLAIGCWLAIAVRTREGVRRVERWSRPAAILAAGLLLILAIRHRGLVRDGFGEQAVGYTLLGVAAAAAIALVITTPAHSRLNRLCGRGLLPILGRYSYGTYVWHGLLPGPLSSLLLYRPRVFGSALPAAVVWWLVLASVAVGLGALSWHAYEKHFLRLKVHFPYEPPRSAPPPTPQGSGPL
jgi:peptidoglycan/LPS O-acetylase OafA/YrhL